MADRAYKDSPLESRAARINAEWLSALKSSGAEQANAIADLRAYVMRAAMHALSRSRSKLGLAEDCAQDALLAILQHLGEFRGESRFTTWVYSFAINIALVAARREGWKRVPLDQLNRRSAPGLG